MTPKELEIIQFGFERGKSPDEVKTALATYRQQSGYQKPQKPQEQQTAESPPLYTGNELKNDSMEMGNALQGTLDEAKTFRQQTRADVASGEISPAKGTFRTLGHGALKGGEFLANAGIGMAKMLLPEKVEQRIRDTLGKDIAETFNAESKEAFLKKLETSDGGVLTSGDFDKKVAESAREVSHLYETDRHFRADVDSSIGFGGMLASLFGGGAKKPRMEGSVPVKQVGVTNPTQTVPIVDRTAQQASEAVVSAANPSKPSIVGDTISGLGHQVKDFGERTVKSAQDTAAQNRRLSEMPEPQAILIRKGADERVVNVVKSAPPEEIAIYKELVEQAKRKEADPTPNTSQPKEIAGREFLKPVNHIIESRSAAGAKLGEIRKSLGTEKNVNTNPAFQKFHQGLKEKYSLEFDADGNIIEGKGLLPATDVKQVQKLYNELRSKTITSQKEIDAFLRRTREQYDVTQQREGTFGTGVSDVAEMARHEIRQLMPDDYNKLATIYAKQSTQLEEVAKLYGFKGRLDDLTTKDLKAGEIALRMLGNAADRPQTVIDNVLKMAEQYGYTSKVDLNRLIYVTDQLEDLYDITPSRGFSGSTQRGIDQSAAGAVGDIATLNVGGLFNKVSGSQATRQEVKEAFEAYVNSL